TCPAFVPVSLHPRWCLAPFEGFVSPRRSVVTHPATFAGSLTRDHAARCGVLGRIHRRTMDTPCVLASLGARDPGSGQRSRAHHWTRRKLTNQVQRPNLVRFVNQVRESHAPSGRRVPARTTVG